VEKKLTSQQAQEVRQKLKTGIAFIDIEKDYHISATLISNINHGLRYKDEKEQYPLFKYYKEDADYDELIDLLLNSDLSLKEISIRLNMGYSTVKKINEGRLRPGLYPQYPIRKTKEQKVKNELLNTNHSIKEIIQKIGCTEKMINNINNGITYRDESLTYPLRHL
jgi:Trp operon repressor